MPSLRAPRIPGSHAVRILLAGTVIAAAAAIIAARSPDGSGASTKGAPDPEATATATIAPGQTPPLATPPGTSGTEVVGGGSAVDVTEEGAVDVPEEGALPADEHVQAATSRFLMPLRQWSHVTDRYGANNRGPGRIHGGIDLALEGLSASPVYSACTGTVRSGMVCAGTAARARARRRRSSSPRMSARPRSTRSSTPASCSRSRSASVKPPQTP